jgi:hypothetical protein
MRLWVFPLIVALLIGVQASQRPAFTRDKPINCEDLLALLDIAIIDWQQLKGTDLILIVRRGTGERDTRLSRTRMNYVEPYLKSKKVQYVLAEGRPVQGFGRMEIYVGGRLTVSIPIRKGVRALCHGSTS